MLAHAASPLLSTALLLLASTGATPEQDVRHSFFTEQVDCVNGGPASPTEQIAIVHEWRSNDVLHLEFWDSEDGSRAIDRNWSRARIKGSKLTLSYRFNDIEYGPNDPIIGCSFPVRVKFDVYGLSRREYKLSVEVTAVARRGKVGD